MFQFLCALLTLSLLGMGYLFQTWIVAMLVNIGRLIVEMLPDTVLSWGMAAISAAFILLGLGSYMSLRRTKPNVAVLKADPG
jgi:hypothetical protein